MLYYYYFIWVERLIETVLLVNGPLFTIVLGMNKDESELFGSMGQLSIHGFIEQNEDQALSCVDASQLENVNYTTTRIFVHNTRIFTQSATEHDILSEM